MESSNGLENLSFKNKKKKKKDNTNVDRENSATMIQHLYPVGFAHSYQQIAKILMVFKLQNLVLRPVLHNATSRSPQLLQWMSLHQHVEDGGAHRQLHKKQETVVQNLIGT